MGFCGADDSGSRSVHAAAGRGTHSSGDDNADMRDYVGRLLGERFHVIAVSDGERPCLRSRKPA